MMRGWTANQLSVQQGSDTESEDQDSDEISTNISVEEPDEAPSEISNEETDEVSSEGADEDEPSNFVPPYERTITIVSVVRPTKILNTLQRFYGFHKTDEPGVYLSDQIIPIRIIHPDELELVPKNYPLLCLSRGKKLQVFMELCLKEGLNAYLQFVLTVGVMADTTAIWNYLMEVYKLKPVVQPETWGYIEEFFKEVPEAFENVPIIHNNFQRARLEALKLGREEGIELGREEGVELGREEGREEGIEQGHKSGKVEQQRTMMLHQLHRKFGGSNEEQLETIVEKIEEIDDLALLGEWFDRILDAHFLHELSL